MFQLEWSVFSPSDFLCYSRNLLLSVSSTAWNCHHYSGSHFFLLLSSIFQVTASTLGFQWNCQRFQSTNLSFCMANKPIMVIYYSHWLFLRVLFPVALGNFFSLNIKGSCFVFTDFWVWNYQQLSCVFRKRVSKVGKVSSWVDIFLLLWVDDS